MGDETVDFPFFGANRYGRDCNQWLVGNYPRTPPAPQIGRAPLEELSKKDGVEPIECVVELADLFGFFFSWSGAILGGAKCSQTPPLVVEIEY